MPFVQVNIKDQINEELENDPEFKELWEERHSQFFKDTMKGLLEATEDIDKTKFSVYLEEQLKDPEFKKEWDALQPEREAIRAEIEAQQK